MKRNDLRKMIQEELLKEASYVMGNSQLRHALEKFMQEYLLDLWTTAGTKEVNSAIKSMRLTEKWQSGKLYVDMYMDIESDDESMNGKRSHFKMVLWDTEA